MTITRVGSNNAYASGWDTAFGGKKRKLAATAKVSNKTVEKSSTKNTAKKSDPVAAKGKSPASQGKISATKGKTTTAVASIVAKGTKRKLGSPKAAAKNTTKKSPAKKKASQKKA